MRPRGESSPKASAMSALSAGWLSLTVKKYAPPRSLLGEDGIASDHATRQRQRLEQLKRCGDLVAIRGQLQLADHAAQGIAEGCQQMHARRRGRGTAAQALAVNGDVSRCATAPHPGPKCGFKARHIQALEQLAPDGRRRNAPAGEAQAGQSRDAQPTPPAHDAELIAPPRQQRCHSDQQKPSQRIPPTGPAPMVPHCCQCRPQAVTSTHRHRRHQPITHPVQGSS